jgi:hypothetical protein
MLVFSSLEGPGIELPGHNIQLSLADRQEIHSLRVILSQQSVRVLLATALPGLVRIAKIDFDVGCNSELGMFSELRASIPSQRLKKDCGDLTHGGDQSVHDNIGPLSGSFIRITKREVCSTSVAMKVPREPSTKSPSQCPGTARSSTSAALSRIRHGRSRYA